MKKIFILSLIILNGCCGMDIGRFNDGNWYYADVCDCVTYKITPEGVDCYNKKGEYTLSPKPLTPEEVQLIMYQQQLYSQQIQQYNQLMQQNRPTNTRCYNNGYSVQCYSY